MKILKIIFIYSGLLLISQIIIGVVLTILLGNNSDLIQIISSLILTTVICYYGTKSLANIPNIHKVLGSPFWQGVTIYLIASLLGTLILYITTKEVVWGQAPLLLIVGGAAGRLAYRMKK